MPITTLRVHPWIWTLRTPLLNLTLFDNKGPNRNVGKQYRDLWVLCNLYLTPCPGNLFVGRTWLVYELFQITILLWIVPVLPCASQARLARWKVHFLIGISKEVSFVTFSQMDGVLLKVRNQKERYYAWSLVAIASQFLALSLSLLQALMNVSSCSCLFESLSYDLMWHVYLWLSTECTPWFLLTIELHPCGCTKCSMYPSLPPSQVGECHIWAYTEARFPLEVPPLIRDTIPRHWNLRKVNHISPLYRFHWRSCPTAVKCIYQTRCSKFTMFLCVLTREDV
jgi:hypothetical protein